LRNTLGRCGGEGYIGVRGGRWMREGQQGVGDTLGEVWVYYYSHISKRRGSQTHKEFC